MWRTSESFPCEVGSPAAARHFATRNLAEMLGGRAGAGAAIADAEVIVSELLTNAVNANCSRTELRLSARDDTVRIEVHDDARGNPRPRCPDADDEHGRGLMIVSALSEDWGFESSAGGKQVWAEILLHSTRPV